MISIPQPKKPRPEGLRSGRTTLKDIALAAKLSVASVSMALRNNSGVSQNTIERVKEIAQRLGYVPDPTLSALAAYRKDLVATPITTTLALITNGSTETEWLTCSHARHFLTGASTRAHDLGYALQPIWARQPGISPQRFDQILKARGIRGIVLAPADKPANELQIDWSHYSVIALERPKSIGPLDFVEPDQYHALTICWEQLISRGYQRAGLIVDEEFTLNSDHRWEAAHAQMQCQYANRSNRIPTLVVSKDAPVRQIRAWLKKHQPDMVISRSTSVVAAVAAENLSIPGDLGYLSLNVHDDIAAATGIAQRYDILGATAIDLLHKQLLSSQRANREISIGTQVCGAWQEGHTLPAIRSERTYPATGEEILQEATA